MIYYHIISGFLTASFILVFAISLRMDTVQNFFIKSLLFCLFLDNAENVIHLVGLL